MTAAVVGRAATAARPAATTATRAPKPVPKAPPASPTGPPAAQPAPPAPSGPEPAKPPAALPVRRGPRLRLPSAGGAVTNGAGFILALLAWGWIGLPFFRGGVDEVRDTLRAKFLNKGPDGSWLP